MKQWLSLPAFAGAALLLSAGTAFAAGPVCSAEFERFAGSYEWRGTILADDGRLYDFTIASMTEAGVIAAIASTERGARGAYEALLDMAKERATVAAPDEIAALHSPIAGAYDADFTVVEGATANGTWSILCFTAPDGPVAHTDPVLVERRGDRIGINAAADELRAMLVALDPVFAIETAAAAPAP